MERNVWHKSSRSGSGGQCVEVCSSDNAFEIRDSKNPHGPTLTFTPAEWAAFIEGVKLGEFD
jgi:uncharacterized protein DUF397